MPLSRCLVLVTVLLAWAAAGLHAGGDVHERQLKAATIVSMLRLVTWPGAPKTPGPLDVVVIGDHDLAAALRDASAGQRVDGRTLTVSAVATVAQLPPVPPPVVVLGAGQRDAVRPLSRVVGQHAVLTIGEGERMGEAGLVIGVYVDGNRIRFDANTAAASRAGLTLSAHLLRLARIVG